MLISVVIPCYNRQKYIGAAIESALAQTWETLEVIVVDDGSTDDSLSIVKSFGDRIKLIVQPNGGVAQARNTGIDAASGDWIALLDSDDIWLPNKLQRQMDVLKLFPESVLLHTLCSTIDADDKPCGAPAQTVSDKFEPEALFKLMHHCFPTTSSVMIRKDVLLNAGKFDAYFEQNGGFAAEDWELYVRVAEYGGFGFVGESLTLYRVHGDSKTLSDKLRHTNGLILLRSRIEGRSAEWRLKYDDTALREALRVHHQQYAHVLARLGVILMSRDDFRGAADAFKKAFEFDSKLKHKARYLWARLRAGNRADTANASSA